METVKWNPTYILYTVVIFYSNHMIMISQLNDKALIKVLLLYHNQWMYWFLGPLKAIPMNEVGFGRFYLWKYSAISMLTMYPPTLISQ